MFLRTSRTSSSVMSGKGMAGWGVLVAWYVVEVGGRGVGEKGGGEDSTFVFGAARQSLRGLKWG